MDVWVWGRVIKIWVLQPVRKGSELLYEYGATYCKYRCGAAH